MSVAPPVSHSSEDDMWDQRVKRLTEKKKRSDSYWAERGGRLAQGVGYGGLKGTGWLGKTARRPAQTWLGLADRLGLGSTGRLGAAQASSWTRQAGLGRRGTGGPFFFSSLLFFSPPSSFHH